MAPPISLSAIRTTPHERFARWENVDKVANVGRCLPDLCGAKKRAKRLITKVSGIEDDLSMTNLFRQMRLNFLHGSISGVRNMSVHKLRDPRITNARLFGHGRPSAAPFIQAIDQIGFQIWNAHLQILAKYCYYRKQHFATVSNDTKTMQKKPINEVLAENLAYFMSENKLTQMALSKESGIGQTTISLYLNPSRRQSGKAGKEPSAKLSEVEKIAEALNVDVWELLRSFSSDDERKAYGLLEQAYKHLHGKPEHAEEKSVRHGKSA